MTAYVRAGAIGFDPAAAQGFAAALGLPLLKVSSRGTSLIGPGPTSRSRRCRLACDLTRAGVPDGADPM
jgi:hypothetical protein